MKKLIVNLYNYEELNDRAKEKALRWWLEDGDIQQGYADDELDMFVDKMISELGLSLYCEDIEYIGSSYGRYTLDYDDDYTCSCWLIRNQDTLIEYLNKWLISAKAIKLVNKFKDSIIFKCEDDRIMFNYVDMYHPRMPDDTKVEKFLKAEINEAFERGGFNDKLADCVATLNNTIDDIYMDFDGYVGDDRISEDIYNAGFMFLEDGTPIDTDYVDVSIDNKDVSYEIEE